MSEFTPHLVTDAIPDDVMVHCPQHNFALRRAAHCAGCSCNAGVLCTGAGDDWAKTHRILCASPIPRQLETVDLS